MAQAGLTQSGVRSSARPAYFVSAAIAGKFSAIAGRTTDSAVASRRQSARRNARECICTGNNWEYETRARYCTKAGREGAAKVGKRMRDYAYAREITGRAPALRGQPPHKKVREGIRDTNFSSLNRT